MEETATIRIGEAEHTYPVIEGTEGERAIDTRKLRAETGYITYDVGFGNTGSCSSEITFVDGEKGILRHRGYPIEQLAEGADFLTTAYLVIYGELPTAAQHEAFCARVRKHAATPEGLRPALGGLAPGAHPMGALGALLSALAGYFPEQSSNDRARELELFDETAALLISQVRTLAALVFRTQQGLDPIDPRDGFSYCENFLHLMFSRPGEDYEAKEAVTSFLDLFLLLHADHEQNCSTSTVRMVASGGANLFASVAAGVGALWGPLHGGANQAVIKMLKEIHASGDDGSKFIDAAKGGEARLMGFGHRVYKNFDPRAKILGAAAEKVFDALGVQENPLLDIARNLADTALKDDYFIQRKLYPNVDFFSGIILNAIGIPEAMFTAMFAIGRMPGWIANWREIAGEKARIHRPRQIYTGRTTRDFIPVEQR